MDFVIFVFNFLFSIAYIVLALRAIVVWLPNSRDLAWLWPIYGVTDPILRIFRLAFPPQKIGFDVSPFLVIFFIWLVQRWLMTWLV